MIIHMTKNQNRFSRTLISIISINFIQLAMAEIRKLKLVTSEYNCYNHHSLSNNRHSLVNIVTGQLYPLATRRHVLHLLLLLGRGPSQQLQRANNSVDQLISVHPPGPHLLMIIRSQTSIRV